MSASLEAQLCAAGAIVSKDPKSDKTMPYAARSYTHPAIEGRTVVQLLPAGLVEAEDLALSTMGLEGQRTEPVGFGARVALGFPAWPLIHDPKNAKHALALVKDLERAARKAKSKPGAAKDSIDALAARLGASAPHFLPTFMEEVGRIFLRLDNKSYAAQFFGKARTAERVHSLAIDEDRHREVFLEFAFAGALTVKALTEEAKELPARVSKEEAYALFRQLSIERVKGGLPPYGAMAKDLRAMAKAAGLNAAEEDQAVVSELLTAPSLKQAAAGFWTAYSKAITAAAKSDPEVKKAVVSLFPSNVDSSTWVTILRTSGAIDLVTSGEIDVSKWLGQIIDHHHVASWRYPAASPELETLVIELSKQLKDSSNAHPSITVTTWRDYDLDLIDVLAEFEIEVVRESRYRSPIDVDDHVQREDNSRELKFLAAAKDWQKLLQSSVSSYLGSKSVTNPQFRTAAAADDRLVRLAKYPGLLSTLRSMVTESLESSGTSLIKFGEALNLAEQLSSQAGVKLVGDLVSALPEPSLEDLVATVFNAGILDELGWPTLEAVITEFQSIKKKDNRFNVNAVWPYAIVSNDQRAVVVGRSGIVIDHTAQIPAEYPLRTYASAMFISVGSDLMVRWQTPDVSGQMAYWASNPRDVFEVASSWLPDWNESLPVGDGARTFADRSFAVSERAFPKNRTDPVYGDGTHFWVVEGGRFQSLATSTDTDAWTELDVATGALGRKSMPSFLSNIAARPGHTVQIATSFLRPLPHQYADNPLGLSSGIVGQCWFKDDAGQLRIERTDAVVSAAFADDSENVSRRSSQMLSLPGGALLLVTPNKIFDARTAQATSYGSIHSRFDFAWGTRREIDESLRQNLSVRHAPTSLKLRTVTGSQLKKLFAVAAVAPVTGERTTMTFTHDELREFSALFPDAPDLLMAGIMAIIRGAKADADIAGILRQQAAQGGEDTPSDNGYDLPFDPEFFAAMPTGFSNLTGHNYGRGYFYDRSDDSLSNLMKSVLASGEMLAQPGTTPSQPEQVRAAQTKQSGGFFKKLLGRKTAEAGPEAATPASQKNVTTRPDWPRDAASWTDVFQSPAALIATAMSPRTTAEDRSRYSYILQSIAESGLAQRAAELQAVRVSGKAEKGLAAGQLHQTSSGNVLLVSEAAQNWPRDDSKVHFAAIAQGKADFGKLGFDVLWSVPAEASSISAAQLQEVVDVMAKQEMPDVTESVAKLVEATGMLEEEARYLLAALPQPEGYNSHFDADAAKELGLNSTSARLAVASFETHDRHLTRTLLTAMVPDNPGDYFTHGPDITKLATKWTEVNGGKVEVDPDFLRQAFAELKGINRSLAIVRWAISIDPGATAPKNTSIQDRLQVCLWLAYNLPAQHPVRALLAKRIMDTKESVRTWKNQTRLGIDTTNAFRTSHGLAAKPRGENAQKDKNPPVGDDSLPPFTVSYGFHDNYGGAYDTINVDTAKFTAADLPFLETINPEHDSSNINIRLLQTLFDGHLDALAAAIANESFAIDGALTNPLISAPETVAAVATSLGVSEDGAVLFLQYLALPDPTNAKVQKWNGWTSARRTKAGKELEDASLVVRAKRARAGRDLFLEGGWVILQGSSLPIEAWKSSIYRLPAGEKPSMRLENLFVDEALPSLFARAWARYESGDKPQYEELRTGR